jgi:hypothetical protein
LCRAALRGDIGVVTVRPSCLMQEYGSSYSCAVLPYAGIWE